MTLGNSGVWTEHRGRGQDTRGGDRTQGAWTGHRGRGQGPGGRGQDTVGVDRIRGHGQDTAVISSTYMVHATWQVLF